MGVASLVLGILAVLIGIMYAACVACVGGSAALFS